MKKIGKIAAAVLIACSGLAFADSKMQIKVNNLEVTVPDGWLATKVNNGTEFMLYSPVEENDSFQENANVTVEKLLQEITPKEYLASARNTLSVIFEGFKVESEGNNFHIYTGTINGVLVKQIQYCAIKNGNAYVFTFSSEPKSFKKYEKTFAEIFKSFKY